MKYILFIGFVAISIFVVITGDAAAHRSGCHRWHSCPSDSGSYTCGDTGKCSYCPDNEYCQGGAAKVTSNIFVVIS